MSLAYGLNSAWMLKCAGELAAFRRATRRVELEQAEVLRAIVRANRETEFGREHGFRSITSPRGFQQNVSLSRFEDFRQSMERIGGGAPRVLTAEPVQLFEPTSGSNGAQKLIPFTDGLRRQFQRGVAAWIGDLFRRRPAIRRGRAYWSISPVFGPGGHTAGGIRIGFDDDAAYLGRFEQWALGRLLVAPPSLAQMFDLDNFRYATLLYLLAADDLALVSVGSPTFLTLLLEAIEPQADRLFDDLRRGVVRVPKFTRNDQRIRLKLRVRPRRADELAAIFRSSAPLPDKLRQTWPRLALVSCWGDAAAAAPLRELKQLLPAVEFQPKGLLATEGIVSFPLIDCAAPALAVRSHFFEFVEVSSADMVPQESREIRLAHELESGRKYRVAMTTAGGLYRYLLGDEIEVVGFANECPLLRFVGRGDRVSDIAGEKLSEPHVRSVLDAAFSRSGVSRRFAMLAPAEDRPARYRLYLQLSTSDSAAALLSDALQQAVEAGLMENPHYRYAVGLGQLAPVEICLLDPLAASAWTIYEGVCLLRSQRAGNIKPTALATGSGWQAAFRPLELPAIAPTTAGTPT